MTHALAKALTVDYIPCMDSIAEAIGCIPDWWRIFFTDPYLWWRMTTTGVMSNQYRMHGPGACYEDSRKILLTACHLAPERTYIVCVLWNMGILSCYLNPFAKAASWPELWF